jgi:glycosyltransferase involved in cell wall biosynthesis
MKGEVGHKCELATKHTKKPLAQLGVRAVVLVWDAPGGSHRSKHLGQHLGADVRHVYFTRKKGWLVAPVKYCCQAIMTLAFLGRHRYQLVFVQNPPVFAALSVYVYSLLARACFVIDSHTESLLASYWRWTLPLHRFLSRRAITTMVTNDYLQQMIASWRAHAFVLRDVPNTTSKRRHIQLHDAGLNVAVVSSASHDEPIDQVMEAARALPDVAFYVTGKCDAKSMQDRVERAPTNVHFTGYLPDEEYYGLLEMVHVVICLTTEDHTHQSGASDALWMGKPIITSDWPLLRRYFDKGTIHADNTAGSIHQALLTMKRSLPAYEAEICALQRERQKEWLEKARALMDLVEQAMPPCLRGRSSQTEGELLPR